MPNLRIVTIIYSGDVEVHRSQIEMLPPAPSTDDMEIAYQRGRRDAAIELKESFAEVKKVTKPKRTNSLKGRHISEEHRRKIGEANRRRSRRNLEAEA